MKKIFAIAGLFISLNCFCQTIQYNPPSPSISPGCDVFSTNPTQSGYTHYGMAGGISYSTGATGIALPVLNTNWVTTGCAYTIGYPLTVGKAYTISVKASSTYSGTWAPSLEFSTSNSFATPAPSCTLTAPSNYNWMFTSPGSYGAGNTAYNQITSSTSTSYTLMSNYYPTPGFNYLNFASNTVSPDQNYTAYITIQEIDISGVSPATAPEVNGGTYAFFNAAHQVYGGYITGTPGATITVFASASGPPGGTYSMEVELTGGATFTDGSTVFTANGVPWKQMICPASGSAAWTGIFTESNSSGSGTVWVQ